MRRMYGSILEAENGEMMNYDQMVQMGMVSWHPTTDMLLVEDVMDPTDEMLEAMAYADMMRKEMAAR